MDDIVLKIAGTILNSPDQDRPLIEFINDELHDYTTVRKSWVLTMERIPPYHPIIAELILDGNTINYDDVVDFVLYYHVYKRLENYLLNYY